jgi:hypothetical protein
MAGTKNSGEEAPLLHPRASDSDVDADVDVPLTTMTNEGRVPSKKRSAKNENDEDPPNIKKRSTRSRTPVKKYAPPPSSLTKQKSSKAKSTDSVGKTEGHEAAGSTIEDNTICGNDDEASEDTKKIAKDDKETISCPHCQKTFSSVPGLKYHVGKICPHLGPVSFAVHIQKILISCFCDV